MVWGRVQLRSCGDLVATAVFYYVASTALAAAFKTSYRMQTTIARAGPNTTPPSKSVFYANVIITEDVDYNARFAQWRR